MVCALAACVLSGTLGMAAAYADTQAAPPSPAAVSCTLPQAGEQANPSANPFKAEDIGTMKGLATIGATDNQSAKDMRQAYANLSATVQDQASAFAQTLSTLQQQGTALQAYGNRDVGSYTQDSCTVKVDKGAAGVTVTMDGNGVSAMSRQSPAFSMVTVKQGDQTQTLQASDTEIQVLDGNVTRTLFLKDAAGHKAGDFEIVIGDGSPSIVGGGQPQHIQHIVAHGANITNETRDRISGFAGDVLVHTIDKFEVPQLVSHRFPELRMTETVTHELSDAVTHQHTKTVHQVRIYQDGSTSAQDDAGAWTHEAPAPRPPQPPAPPPIDPTQS